MLDVMCKFDKGENAYRCNVWNPQTKNYQELRGREVVLKNVPVEYFEGFKEHVAFYPNGESMEREHIEKENVDINETYGAGWDFVYLMSDKIKCREEDGRIICIPKNPNRRL